MKKFRQINVQKFSSISRKIHVAKNWQNISKKLSCCALTNFFPKTKIKPFNTFYSWKHFKIICFISLQWLSSPKLYHNRLLLANWLNSITSHSVEKQEIYSHLILSWKQITMWFRNRYIDFTEILWQTEKMFLKWE